MLIDDACIEYAELAGNEPNPADQAFYRFLAQRAVGLDLALLPSQHRDLAQVSADKRRAALDRIDDPLARLLDASLLVMRQEADAAVLATATETASEQGWRQPLLTYLKLRQQQADKLGQTAESAQLARRIRLVEESLAQP